MTALAPAAARWLEGVLADTRLTDTDKLVARAIALHMDDRGRVEGTDADIARWVAELKAESQ